MENANATPTPEVDSKRALEAAYRHYESRLFRAALRITHNEDDAWDAVQDGMVNALRRAEHFRGDSAVASWLYSIVVNAALYQGRRERATRKHARDFCERVWPDADRSLAAGTRHRDPEAYVHARIDLERASELIDALPPERRRLVMESASGESCVEIAEDWGLPVAAVKSRLCRARVSLRAKFGAAS
ncbi:MAG: RNA polymerase sigma factor [Polyangiales bacterium]